MTVPKGLEDPRRFIEGQVVLMQTVVEQKRAFETYQKVILPDHMADRDLALVDQGFGAGWQAALAAVGMIIWEANADWRTRR